MPRARREAGHAKQNQTMGSQDTDGGGSTCCSLLWDEVGVGLEGGLAGRGSSCVLAPGSSSSTFHLGLQGGCPEEGGGKGISPGPDVLALTPGGSHMSVQPGRMPLEQGCGFSISVSCRVPETALATETVQVEGSVCDG